MDWGKGIKSGLIIYAASLLLGFLYFLDFYISPFPVYILLLDHKLYTLLIAIVSAVFIPFIYFTLRSASRKNIAIAAITYVVLSFLIGYTANILSFDLLMEPSTRMAGEVLHSVPGTNPSMMLYSAIYYDEIRELIFGYTKPETNPLFDYLKMYVLTPAIAIIVVFAASVTGGFFSKYRKKSQG